MSRPTSHGSPVSTDAAGRLAYLDAIVPRLWPGSRPVLHRGIRARATFLLLPSAATPRLLVPATNRRAAAAAVLGYGEQTSRTAQLKAGLLSAALRGGAGVALRDRVELVGGDAGLPGRLAASLGRPLLVSMHLGPPRANRKPVLQLLGHDGQVLGFAKIGSNPLTRRLVLTETAALRRLSRASLAHVTTASPLHTDSWRDLEVLVQSPLPVAWSRSTATGDLLRHAMTEVAHLDRTGPVPLVDSPYWATLRSRIAALPDGDVGGRLSALIGGLTDTVGADAVELGSWHGDWTPWNMAAIGAGKVAVWDWERFGAGVPIGFDPLHYELQAALVVARHDPAEAVRSCLHSAAAVLRTYGVAPRAAEITAACYLTDIATRYCEDGQAEAGARLGRVQDWLLPLLGTAVERLNR